MNQEEICPVCGNRDVNLFDTTYEEEKGETIGHYNCFHCMKSFNYLLEKGL